MRNIVFLLAFLAIFTTALASAQTKTPPEDSDKYIIPTIESLSKLYWAISKFAKDDDVAVDNFILIHRCDVYKKYYHDEFKWQKVRDAMKKYLQENKSSFPLRYQFTVPIKLGNYDIAKSRFEVINDYKISATRRFEVTASNPEANICGIDVSRSDIPFEGYPSGMIVELSRPVDIKVLPVDKDTARQYVDRITKKLHDIGGDPRYEKYREGLRDAYVILKVKIFAYRQTREVLQGPRMAEVMGVLERMEIYGDPERKMLLFFEDYGTRKKIKGNNVSLQSILPDAPMLFNSGEKKSQEDPAKN